jgi:hypothetical protein
MFAAGMSLVGELRDKKMPVLSCVKIEKTCVRSEASCSLLFSLVCLRAEKAPDTPRPRGGKPSARPRGGKHGPHKTLSTERKTLSAKH